MKVLVAMSGGVDSSVAAGLLIEAGHEVVGATLKLWGGAADSGCCSVADVDDARRVAQMLGIDHHIFNYTEEFERHVVAPFVAGHAAGRTPNPCIECNRHIKFDLLFDRAKRLGFDVVATGHHAQVVARDGKHLLARGADDQKDQSYVLGYLTEAELSMLLLPIGAMTKDEVRVHAEGLGLRTWNKPDSQDVCFIEASKGREVFLRQRLTPTPATIVDRSTGDVLGAVDAAELVTVGQRRGVVPGRDGEKRYVAKVDLLTRRRSRSPTTDSRVVPRCSPSGAPTVVPSGPRWNRRRRGRSRFVLRRDPWPRVRRWCSTESTNQRSSRAPRSSPAREHPRRTGGGTA